MRLRAVLGLFLLLLVLGLGFYVFKTNSFQALITSPFSTPGPLRYSANPSNGNLTINGILTETNKHRQENNRSSLALNTTLSQAAEKKLNDMAEQQYFEHVSPQGVGPGEVVDSVGYAYLSVGENLALGNFANDQQLVQAWMDSPGHRENIVSKKFTEIGIATKKVIFEGNTTWLAVQEFGRPQADCTSPQPSLQKQYSDAEKELNSLNSTLSADLKILKTLETEIKSLLSQADSLTAQGNAKIEEGNNQIKKGNQVYQQTGSREQAEPYWEQGEQLQAEGKKLQEQAQDVRNQAEVKQAEFKTLQNTYNSNVTHAQSLDTELSQLSTTLNQQIRTYNSCLGLDQ